MKYILALALITVTCQVLILRRHFVSLAWNLMAAGFVVIALIVLCPQLSIVSEIVRQIVALIGYVLLIVGYEIFRQDAKSLRRSRMKSGGH